MEGYRDIRDYHIVGYDAYYKEVLPALEAIERDTLRDDGNHFTIAVTEAVCNAARYSVDGYFFAPIDLHVVITEDDITVSITSKTQPFDVKYFREQMRKLADDPAWHNRKWSEYTAATERSRGYWLMLMSVDYLYITEDGQTVSLVTSIPFRQNHVSRKIGDIVPRLLLQNDNGVIY